MGKRSAQPGELVRLSPLQFSLSVSIVVILMGAAGLAGYYYGMQEAASPPVRAEESLHHEQADQKTDTAVTFYSALKEPREEIPQPRRENPEDKGSGTGRSPVEVSPVSEQAVESPKPFSGGIILQVASYKKEALGRTLLSELSADGISGTIIRADLGQRGIWYRVRVGPYPSEKAANRVLELLRRERNLKGYIVR